MAEGLGLPRRPLCFDWNGNALPINEWAQYMERLADEGKVSVEVTQVGEKQVSTAFQGVDYSHGMGPVPMIFETMIFPDCDRAGLAPDEESARKLHEQVVSDLQRASN